MNLKLKKSSLLLTGLLLASGSVSANETIDICPNDLTKVAIQSVLETLLKDAQAEENGGFGFHMWATMVNRAGEVCAIAHSGEHTGDQWPGSRAISAQKANTANAFSLPGFALSSANLHQATQDGGSLYGLQESNPVDTSVAYAGSFDDYGTASDPMMGKKIGGINVFGGGLALYSSDGEIVGAVGVSGDSSCADHNIAWRVRHAGNFDYVPAGPSPTANDQIIYAGESDGGAAGFEHPDCGHTEKEVAAGLPETRSVETDMVAE
ncbi:MAG: heme-binding protein [Methyloprofundus sp.]|nr:heme-binding protein [Methyloprofundus sp.]